MLEYENQMFLDLLHEDGLLIAAKGLNIEKVFLNFIKVYADPGNLVLVLGTTSNEEEYFIQQLEADGVKCLPKSITTEFNANDRHIVYMQAGVLFVTPRILVVDMLKERVPIDLITGILIYRAHKVEESCQDAFILRLYREKNKTGFIKAFSNSPVSFTMGFCQVNRIMRNLFVKNLYLWPRFHALVSSNLEKSKPEVVELQLNMTPAMLSIQTAVLDLLSFTVKELKRLNRTLDTDEITVENVIGKSFDKVVKLHIDPMWHQLSSKTRQLVADLKTLKTVLVYLTSYDCVTFNTLVNSLRTTEQALKTSGWMLLQAAETLFLQSSARVSGKESNKEPDSNKGPEISPKWEAVSEVLKEIGNESRVLIVVNDFQTSRLLDKYIKYGASEVFKDIVAKDSISTSSESKTVPEKSTNQPKKSSKKDKNQETLTQMMKLPDEDNDRPSSPLTTPTIKIYPLQDRDMFNNYKVLEEYKPLHVILYDPAMAFVRQVEVYQARCINTTIHVYFMIYSGSVEEQAYLTTLRKEKEAFEHLIHEKATMVIPEEREGRNDANEDLLRDPTKASETTNMLNTRKGGSALDTRSNRKVLVDMREFRSELPSLIHRRGIDIEPVTLDIGDYILTPDICVERKSISDLIGSLNSGRLLNQAQQMTRHYSQALLLIEFDSNKPFILQGKYFVSSDTASRDVTSKLQLLLLHFPKLRILWSPSPYATAEIFDDLKKDKPEPDATKVPLITQTNEEMNDSRYNSAIYDFMLKLPGVNSKNIYAILNKGGDLTKLCELSVEELTGIIGNSAAAETLHNSLHKSLELETVSSAKSAKPRKKFKFSKQL